MIHKNILIHSFNSENNIISNIISRTSEQISKGKIVFGFLEGTDVNINNIAFLIKSIEIKEESVMDIATYHKIIVSLDTTDNEYGKSLDKLLKLKIEDNFIFSTIPDLYSNYNVNQINFIKIGFKNTI